MPYELPDLAVTGEVIPAAWGNKNRTNWSLSPLALATAAGQLFRATGAGAIEAFNIGSPGYGLLVNPAGTAQVWAEVLPWEIDLNVVVAPPAASSGYTGPFPTNGTPAYYVSVADLQNSYVEWPVVLAAGTWSFFSLGFTGGGLGIATVSLDGVSVGTIDAYTAGAQVQSVQKSLTGIVVAAAGKKLLRLTNASKNGSSSGYALLLQGLKMRRTA